MFILTIICVKNQQFFIIQFRDSILSVNDQNLSRLNHNFGK